MPSARSSRINLANWRQRANLRSANETLMVKHAIWQWYLQPEEQREPATRGALGRRLGVSRQYVDEVIKWMLLEIPPDFSEKPTVTTAEVQHARERREQLRHDEMARDTVSEAQTPSAKPVSSRPTTDSRDQQYSAFNPYTKPRTFQEWERLGMLDGPRRVRR